MTQIEALKLGMQALSVLQPSNWIASEAKNKAWDAMAKAIAEAEKQPAQTPPAGYALIHESALRAWGKLDEVKEACCHPAQKPPNCGTGYCSCIECLFEQPAQELEADALIRKYINALVANNPDEAASATKSMVDYVYGITKGGA